MILPKLTLPHHPSHCLENSFTNQIIILIKNYYNSNQGKLHPSFKRGTNYASVKKRRGSQVAYISSLCWSVYQNDLFLYLGYFSRNLMSNQGQYAKNYLELNKPLIERVSTIHTIYLVPPTLQDYYSLLEVISRSKFVQNSQIFSYSLLQKTVPIELPLK